MLLICGNKESKNKTVTVRKLGSSEQKTLKERQAHKRNLTFKQTSFKLVANFKPNYFQKRTKPSWP